ncbi:MAG: protein translocase subunit SecD [Acidobacteriota bacterium]|nr:protein translocase subunit SecD [Acidobacteriota bacterium]
MDKKILWRVILIVVVVGLSLWSLYPPGEKIHYGLDLSGGIHLVLQVQTDDAIKAELDDSAQRLVSRAREEGVELTQGESKIKDLSFSVNVPADTDTVKLREVASNWVPGYTANPGAGTWTFELPPNMDRTVRDMAVRSSLETIWNRVDQFGVAEPVIQRQGIDSDRILVQLPGVDDPARVKDLISSTAFLEFQEVVGGPMPDRQTLLTSIGGIVPSDSEIVAGDREGIDGAVIGTDYYLLKKAAIISGQELRSARRSQDEYGQPVVNFATQPHAADKFGQYTGSHIGTRMAIVLDQRVISAPVIESRIPGEGRITGNFTIEEAEDLGLKLRAGALPATITYLEERTVGPSLGRDSVVRGVRAAVAGLLVVMLFMLVYYRMSGLNANVALVLNIVILLGAMAYFGATLTLPGIAGVILTIGMAVDANVLIFERIREELKVGKTVRAAIDTGFARAFGTILDANLTTLIAALFLFNFGTGPVKGFAVTLSIGILASVFTAVFVSRTVYMIALGGRDRVESLSI